MTTDGAVRSNEYTFRDHEYIFKYLGRPDATVAITAVGFDLDYTLVVPERDRSQLLNDAAAAVGAPPISRETYLEAHRQNLTGRTREPIFEEILADSDTNARPHDLAREYREVVNEAIVPVPGAESMLVDLRKRYRVGLLTNGPTVAQRGKLAALGWEDVFDAVAITGELAAGKPDGAAFQALLTVLDADSQETAYVGDEVEADVGGATGAGLSAIQVLYPGGPERDPRASAHVERAELAELLPTVLESL